LDHDDVLEPDAIEQVVQVLNSDPEIDYVYTDEDLLNERDELFSPFRKPDWSPERFRNQMYVCHFSVIRKSLLDDVNGFREGFDGSQDYDLILRVSEQARKIRHIPIILYHWRTSDESVAANPNAKPYAYSAGVKAISDHLARVGIEGTVYRRHDLPGNYQVIRSPTYSNEIDVLVYGTPENVNYWGTHTDSMKLTEWSLHNHSTFQRLNIQQSVTDKASSCSLINDFISRSKTEFVVLSSDGVAISTHAHTASHAWCESFVGLMQSPDVAIVGGYTWTQGSRLKHCAFSIGEEDVHIDGLRIGQHITGVRAIFRSDREVSAIYPHFVMIRVSDFLDVGGLDDTLPPLWAWIDLCFKLRSNGSRVVSTPSVNTYDFCENSEVVNQSDLRIPLNDVFKSRWLHMLTKDPYSIFRPEQIIHRKAKWKP
jgi:GT2 family glycosyltransferase